MTEREYNECVHQYADNVFRFIVKNLRHEEDAKDVVQSAFEKLWRNRDAVETNKSKSYLFTVAYNQMIDHLRKAKRIHLQETFSAETKVQHQPVHNMKKALHEALVKLNVRHGYEEYDGDHTNRVKERVDRNMLPFFARYLAAPPNPTNPSPAADLLAPATK